ncbi:MAG: sigma-E factor negative regulatory protein [Betaproteobacteria bacterium]
MDKISALMDGELDGRQTQHELARLRQDGELRQTWNTFHLIGDALRGERMLLIDVAGLLSRRLADEPTVLAPQRDRSRKVRTYALSAAASVAAIALVGWVALAAHQGHKPAEIAQVQQGPVAPAVLPIPAPVQVAPVASVPYDGSHNEYILAHQGFSPSTAIQGVAPYIRGVSARRQSLEDR